MRVWSLVLLLVGALALGCGPHYKHYRGRGQAAHYPDCRPKCPAQTQFEWHERRKH